MLISLSIWLLLHAQSGTDVEAEGVMPLFIVGSDDEGSEME